MTERLTDEEIEEYAKDPECRGYPIKSGWLTPEIMLHIHDILDAQIAKCFSQVSLEKLEEEIVILLKTAPIIRDKKSPLIGRVNIPSLAQHILNLIKPVILEREEKAKKEVEQKELQVKQCQAVIADVKNSLHEMDIKLNDREADLINAKNEERSNFKRILVEEMGFNPDYIDNLDLFKEGK